MFLPPKFAHIRVPHSFGHPHQRADSRPHLLPTKCGRTVRRYSTRPPDEATCVPCVVRHLLEGFPFKSPNDPPLYYPHNSRLRAIGSAPRKGDAPAPAPPRLALYDQVRVIVLVQLLKHPSIGAEWDASLNLLCQRLVDCGMNSDYLHPTRWLCRTVTEVLLGRRGYYAKRKVVREFLDPFVEEVRRRMQA